MIQPLIETILITPDPALKEALHALLKKSEQDILNVIAEIDTTNRLREASALKMPQLVIYAGSLTAPDALPSITRLSESFPHSYLIVFNEVTDLVLLLNYVRAGVSGFIPTTATVDEFHAALTHIIAGEAFISPSITRTMFDYLRHSPDSLNRLTLRQQQIVKGIVDGLSYKLIADKHKISIDTVREHIKNIYKTLRINSKAELMAMLRFYYL